MKKKNLQNTLATAGIQDSRAVAVNLLLFRIAELLLFCFFVFLFLQYEVTLLPRLMQRTARWEQGLRISIITLYYVFSFSGYYFGIRFYQQRMRKSPLTPAFRIFEQGFLYNWFSMLKLVCTEFFKRHIAVIVRFWPITVLVFFMLFNGESVLTQIGKAPFLYPFVWINFAKWMFAFMIRFWIGLILLGPCLFAFLYSDWWPVALGPIKNFYQFSYREKFRHSCFGFPIGTLCAFLLYRFFEIPLWIVVLYVVIGLIQLAYYYLRWKKVA